MILFLSNLTFVLCLPFSIDLKSDPKNLWIFDLPLDSLDKIVEAMATHTLTTGWEFKQTDTQEWLPVARVPTNVHLDLMDNRK